MSSPAEFHTTIEMLAGVGEKKILFCLQLFLLPPFWRRQEIHLHYLGESLVHRDGHGSYFMQQ